MTIIKIVVLGAGNAMPASGHLYSQLALIYGDKCAVIDSGNNPINSLLDRGVSIDQIEHIVLTHFHPDHVAALPNLLTELKIRGRITPLIIHGNPFTIERVGKLIELFGLAKVPGKYSIELRVFEETENALVFENDLVRVTATSMMHFVPTSGLSFENLQNGKSIGYTCDTEPCSGVASIAKGKGALFHECTGKGPGHSSAEEAALAARAAEVDELILIHYPTDGVDPHGLVKKAEAIFAGKISLAETSMERVID